MRRRTAAGLAVIAALVAGCGSTVQTGQSAVGLAPSGVATHLGGCGSGGQGADAIRAGVTSGPARAAGEG